MKMREKTQGEKDAELNASIAVKSLFGSGGWQMFKERVKERVDCEGSAIDPHMFENKPISAEERETINFHIAKRRALLEVLGLEMEMLQEVDPEYDPDNLEKVGFDMKPKEDNSPVPGA